MTIPSKVAIVTGAGQGIGAEIARELARRGHAVGVVDVNETGAVAVAREITEAGGAARAYRADVSVTGEVSETVEAVAAELGPPLIMVNNAGITRDNMIHKMPDADWDSVIAVHLRGPFLFCRAVQPYMREAQWGRIVNMSSIGARGNRGQVNYSTAKAGIQGFTKALAFELGRYNVTANAVGPGFVDTDMTRRTADRLKMTFADFAERAAAGIPVGRVGQTSDIARTVAFLASEDASFVSGQVIYVAGGPIG